MCQITADMTTLMNAAAVDTMPTTATVQHPVVSQSTLKTAVKSYAATAFTTVCRVTTADTNGLNEQMRKIAEKYVGKRLSKILFPGGTDVRNDDQVTVVDGSTTRRFKIVSVDTTISYRITDTALAVEFDGV